MEDDDMESLASVQVNGRETGHPARRGQRTSSTCVRVCLQACFIALFKA